MSTKFILNPDQHLPLLHLCTARVGALLRDQYYYPVGKAKTCTNPFKYFPSYTINELFEMVMRAKRKTRASVTNMLRPLLTSGRLTELVFDFRKFAPKDYVEIFQELDSRVSYVRKISFESFDHYYQRCLLDEPTFIQSIKDFVLKCKNIEGLIIPSPAFEMTFISELPKLKDLTIWPFQEQKINEEVMEVPHNNLTRVNIEYLSVSKDMLVTLLTYCPNLICLKNDISEALRELHRKQLSDDTLSKVYNLQEYILDDTALDMAFEMCPMTKILRLEFTTNVLSQQHSNSEGFKNVESLTVYRKHFQHHQYHQSLNYFQNLEVLLQSIGHGLKHLTLECERVDFEALGTCCPNLASLKVVSHQSHDVRHPLARCFTKLESLSLLPPWGRPLKGEVLSYVLRSCKQLSELRLKEVRCLTDELLDNLLRTNGMKCLRKVSLWECALSERGIVLLLQTYNHLEEISIYSLLVQQHETIHRIIQDFYPRARHPAIHPVSLVDSYPIEKRPSRSRKRSLPE